RLPPDVMRLALTTALPLICQPSARAPGIRQHGLPAPAVQPRAFEPPADRIRGPGATAKAFRAVGEGESCSALSRVCPRDIESSLSPHGSGYSCVVRFPVRTRSRDCRGDSTE